MYIDVNYSKFNNEAEAFDLAGQTPLKEDVFHIQSSLFAGNRPL